MSTATATLTEYQFPNALFEANNFMEIMGTVAIQAASATYATGGLSITWNLPSNRFSSNSSKPASAIFYSILPNPVTNLFVYVYIPSTGKLAIYTGAAAQTGLTELTDASAIPAGVSGDTIEFRARFVRF